ncbi:EAL domain, c-di-GMP-specific phosphodiesterase class I (or its enzymatically inactive variant) [Eubacterium ruminantium]|nr:EAL domain, c-di-GMP-specific phosphodiesterase class I (or its enzymatically inactive variant) [Eubacterium ruminantium]
MVKGRLAVLTGQADEAYQSEFLMGLEKQAFADGYDVCVFSVYIKYQNTPEREKGEANIFTLIDYAMFDAVIAMADSIQTPGLWEELEEDIHDRFNGPVIVIDKDSKYFKSFWTDGHSLIYALVSHLIEVHNYKDIAFLAGKSWHRHSMKRLEAYKKAMTDHDLPVNNERIYFGDFWYSSGESCANSLIESGQKLPEAVACANDCMAIGFAKGMTEKGKRIPEDIAITGYGTSEEGRTCPSPLTSSVIPAEYFGKYSAKSVIAMMEGKNITIEDPEPSLFIGSSCGCRLCQDKREGKLRKTWDTVNSVDGFNSIHNFVQEDMLKENSVRGYLDVVYSYIFQLIGIKNFYLCLNEIGLKKGYTDNVLMAIKYNSEREKDNTISIRDYRSKSDIMNQILAERDKPAVFFFTPIYFEDISYGFAAISYGNVPRSYDEDYRMWINAACRGYEVVRRNEELVNLRSKVWSETEKKKAKMMSLDELSDSEKILAEKVKGLLDNNTFKYCFQPIVKADTGEIYSYEALMRSGTPDITPFVILKYAEMMGRLDDIERCTFNNILKQVDDNLVKLRGKKVFINSIPSVFLPEEERQSILRHLNKLHETVVVEITESADMDESHFGIFKEGMRQNDIHIALDDYGTGYSNISNLLRFMPSYVKIDRSLITDLQKDVNKQYFVREIIDFCHESDIMALAEGVETYQELEMSIKLGVDLIQGFYTARPDLEMIDAIDPMIINDILKINVESKTAKEASVYSSGRSSWLSLNALSKDDYNRIRIVGENVAYRDVTLAGNPGHQVEMSIDVNDGYSGTIVLENCSISSVKNAPCMSIGENCNVALVLRGDNYFRSGGISVPESSKLTITGEGNLDILISSGKCVGIGNSIDKACGEINFHQDGKVRIKTNGRVGIGIGAGLGGSINIERGQYEISLSGEEGVGIGTLTGNITLDIRQCDIFVEMNTQNGVCIGSLEGNAMVSMLYSSARLFGNGDRFVACGTLDGKNAEVTFIDGSIKASARSPYSTLFGSLYGRTEFMFERGQLRLENYGENALIFGGKSLDTHVKMMQFDCKSEVRSELKKDTYALADTFIVIDGNGEFWVNGDRIERKLSPYSS